MSELKLGKDQETALKRALFWYNLEKDKQILTISGGPGTGKSFVSKYIIRALNLQPYQVRFCTFTGRASLVLWERGVPSTTIHQLIYNTIIEDVPALDRNGNEIKDINGNVVFNKELISIKKPSLNPLIRLIVVDEISMVNEKLLNDLKSYGIKLICIGDKDQLPPVGGKNNNLLDDPDIILYENFRQGDDSMIVDVANHIIKGGSLEYGKYADNVVVAPKDMITPKLLLMADQVLCTTNKRRKEVNNIIREELGYKTVLPSVGDKVVATTNNWLLTQYSKRIKDELPIVNGLIGHCKKINYQQKSRREFGMDFVPQFDKDVTFYNIICDMQDFYDYSYKFYKKDKINNFDFGYALTVHKAQGSEFNKVVFIADQLRGDDKFYRSLLYTGITRATKSIIIFI